jgi:hypothetical protein
MPRAKKTEETKPVAKKKAPAKPKAAPKPAAKKAATKPKTTTKPVAKKKAPVKKPVARKSVAKADTQVIKPTNDIDKFPYETFPYRLEHQEAKGKKICWFSHESHVHKYIERHKLTKKDYVAECFSNLY